MNYRIIFYIVGWVFNLQAIFMVLPCLTAVIYGENDPGAFLVSIVICLAIGLPLTRKRPRNKVLYKRRLYCSCPELDSPQHHRSRSFCTFRLYSASH